MPVKPTQPSTITSPVRTPLEPDAVTGGTRTKSGSTYGDWVPAAVADTTPAEMKDPSRGAEMERDVEPATADFSRRPDFAGASGPGEPAGATDREQRIREAAYHRWLQRGGDGDGMAEEDWLAAEADIDRVP